MIDRLLLSAAVVLLCTARSDVTPAARMSLTSFRPNNEASKNDDWCEVFAGECCCDQNEIGCRTDRRGVTRVNLRPIYNGAPTTSFPILPPEISRPGILQVRPGDLQIIPLPPPSPSGGNHQLQLDPNIRIEIKQR